MTPIHRSDFSSWIQDVTQTKVEITLCALSYFSFDLEPVCMSSGYDGWKHGARCRARRTSGSKSRSKTGITVDYKLVLLRHVIS